MSMMRFPRFFVFQGKASSRRFSLMLSRDPVVQELSRVEAFIERRIGPPFHDKNWTS